MNNITDDNLDTQNDFDQFDNFDVNADDDQVYGDDFSEEQKPKGKKTLVTIIFLLLLAGLGAGGYVYYFKPLLNAQHVSEGDGAMPDAPVAAGNDALPPSVTTSDNVAPADMAPPPPPPVPDADVPPPAPPVVGDDGTLPDDVTLNQLPEAAPAVVPPAPADAAAATTPPAPPAVDATDMANSALPAPTAAPAPEAAATVDAPERVATPSLTNDDTIRPSLPEPTATTMASSDSLTPVTPPAADQAAIAPAPEPVVEPAVEAAPAPAEQPVPATTDSTMADTKVAALEDKINALPSAEMIAKLTSQLEAVTQRLDALDKRTETLATELQNREAAPSPSVVEEKPAPQAAPEEAPPAPAPVKKAAPKKAAVKPKPVAVNSSWQLRSAQPGAAWLSKPGSEEMVRYTVGQALPGSGMITAITQESGSWVVKTDRGLTIRP